MASSQQFQLKSNKARLSQRKTDTRTYGQSSITVVDYMYLPYFQVSISIIEEYLIGRLFLMISGYTNNNNNNQSLQQNPSLNQSPTSSYMMISKLQSKELGMDDYNLKKNFGQSSNEINNPNELLTRNQQYKNKKQKLFNEINGINNLIKDEDQGSQILSQKQASYEERQAINTVNTPSAHQISAKGDVPIKRRQRREDTQDSTNQNSALKIIAFNDFKKDFDTENKTNLSKFKSGNGDQTNQFNTFGQESMVHEYSEGQISQQIVNRSAAKKPSIAFKIQKVQQDDADEVDSPKNQFRDQKKLTFADEDNYHFFDVIENNADYLQEFQLIQQTAFIQAKQKYQGEENLLKSILKKPKKVSKLIKQNSRSLTDLAERSPLNLGPIDRQIQATILLKKRQNMCLDNSSSIIGQQQTNSAIINKQNKKGKRDSGSIQFASLKKAYEKDNYIKRLSSVSLQKVEKFHQFLNKQNIERKKKQRIFYFFYNFVVDFICLNLMKLEVLDKTIIHFYSVVIKYFRLFQNTTLIGTLIFLYNYASIDIVYQIKWPFTYSSSTYSDNPAFLTSQSVFTSYIGLLLFILLTIQVFSKGEFVNSSLFVEKQATRLIFNSIKWNNFCQNRSNYLFKKYKIYDKIIEDNDHYEGHYPYGTLAFIILIEILLITFNLGALFFLLYDQMLLDSLNNLNLVSECSLLAHIIIGALIVILVKINHLAIKQIYVYITKINYSDSEKFMMQGMYFNTFLIYFLFQFRYISVFNNSINLSFLNRIQQKTPVANQILSQIGFVIALSALFLIYTIAKCLIFSNQDNFSFFKQRMYASNKIFDTANTNINEEQKKQTQQEDKIIKEENNNNNRLNSSKDEIENPQNKIKNSQVTPETHFTQSKIYASEDQQKSSFYNNRQFKLLPLSNQNQKKNSPLIIKSAYYLSLVLFISMMNSSILNCIFTYPLLLPLGCILNLLLMISIYIVNKQIDPSGCLSFLTNREFKQMVNQIIYTSVSVSIIQNFLIGNSDQDNSDVQIKQSLFQQGLSYLYDIKVINQFIALISLPYILITVLIYLSTTLYMQNKSHKNEFIIYKNHLEKSKEPLNSQATLSVSKQDIKKMFNFL
ncbi:hypothetical protein ABPG74_003857 [Tetrahymena malaccensis]